MAEFKYRVVLEAVDTYLVTVHAESEEEACRIMDDECWEWKYKGCGEDVVITSGNYHSEANYCEREEQND